MHRIFTYVPVLQAFLLTRREESQFHSQKNLKKRHHRFVLKKTCPHVLYILSRKLNSPATDAPLRTCVPRHVHARLKDIAYCGDPGGPDPTSVVLFYYSNKGRVFVFFSDGAQHGSHPTLEFFVTTRKKCRFTQDDLGALENEFGLLTSGECKDWSKVDMALWAFFDMMCRAED
jgi:hypothetical protein